MKTTLSALAVLWLVAGCLPGDPPPESQVDQVITRKLTKKRIKEALTQPQAFLVNLQNNRVTYFEDGNEIDSWNIATGDITGDYHRGDIKPTPQGIFRVHRMVRCPIWRPQLHRYTDDGEKIPLSWEELQREFSRRPDRYGACGRRNPLGEYVLWFWGAYGYHGNSNESVLRRPDIDTRRVSGGCIRNPNSRIKQVFHRILDRFEASGQESMLAYKQRVLASESEDNPQTELGTTLVSRLDIRLVIGYFDEDEDIIESRKPKFCKVVKGDPYLVNVVRVFKNIPENPLSGDYETFVDVGDTAEVVDQKGDWYKVVTPRFAIQGWVEKNRMGQCQF